MTSFPNSPRILKGGIVLMDAQSSKVLTVISLQYNPESLTRSLQVQGFGGENPEHSEALRLKGPAIETIKLEADIDATDQLEFPNQNQDAVQHGVQPQLAALEALINPSSQQLRSNNNLAASGTLEIAPMESPLSLFVWSQHRIVPIRVTEFSITEEAFDVALNPIRAKVNLSFRVLSVSDLGFDHKGSHVFMSYLQNKERLASKVSGVGLNTFGIGGIP